MNDFRSLSAGGVDGYVPGCCPAWTGSRSGSGLGDRTVHCCLQDSVVIIVLCHLIFTNAEWRRCNYFFNRSIYCSLTNQIMSCTVAKSI